MNKNRSYGVVVKDIPPWVSEGDVVGKLIEKGYVVSNYVWIHGEKRILGLKFGKGKTSPAKQVRNLMKTPYLEFRHDVCEIEVDFHLLDWYCEHCMARNSGKGYCRKCSKSQRGYKFALSSRSVQETCILKLSWIPEELHEKDLHEIYVQLSFVPVKRILLARNVSTFQSEKVAYMEFFSVDDARKALRLIEQKGFFIKELLVSVLFVQPRDYNAWQLLKDGNFPLKFSLNGFVYDVDTKLHYNENRELYFDVETEYYYDPKIQNWLYLDPNSDTLIAVEKRLETLEKKFDSKNDQQKAQGGGFFGFKQVSQNAVSESKQKSISLSKPSLDSLFPVSKADKCDLIDQEKILVERVNFCPELETDEFSKARHFLEKKELSSQMKEIDKLLQKQQYLEFKNNNQDLLPQFPESVSEVNPQQNKRLKQIQKINSAPPITRGQGFALLKKLGWKEGSALGKNPDNTLDTNPISLPLMSREKAGVGYK